MGHRPQDTALPEGNRSGGRSPKGQTPRVVVWRCPRHDTLLPNPWPLGPKRKTPGVWGLAPKGVEWCQRMLWSPAGSCGLAVRVTPFAGAASSFAGAVFGLARESFGEAVAAAVDGDDFGAVEQTVEDGSGGGHVA